jgi:hypothetical protein
MCIDRARRMNDETSVSFFVTSPTTVVRGMKRQSDAAFTEEGDGARRIKRRVSARLAPTSDDDGGAVAMASGDEAVKRIAVPKPRAVAPLGKSRVGNVPAPRMMKTKTIPAPRGVGESGVGVVDAVAVKSKTRSGLNCIPRPLGGTVGGAVDENDAA